MRLKTTLTIAGSDCSGGAGIQADIKTITMNNVYAMSIITSLTAQNTLGVQMIENCSKEIVDAQLESIFTDIFPDAIKIGMVNNCETIDVIYNKLVAYKAKNIVLDPVMISSTGAVLLENDALKNLKEKLFKIATLVTPNIHEAEMILEIEIKNEKDMENAAKLISEKFHCNVLIKGGHQINDANDVLCFKNKIYWFKKEKIKTNNTHGTGCSLSSAIASNLAKGFDLLKSIDNAKEFVYNALKNNKNIGKGIGPINHLFKFNNN